MHLDFVDENNSTEVLDEHEYYIQLLHALLMREAYFRARLSYDILSVEAHDYAEWQLRLVVKAQIITAWEIWDAGHEDIVVNGLDPSTMNDLVIAMC